MSAEVQNNVVNVFEKALGDLDITVGIIKDEPEREPKDSQKYGLKKFAGMQARKSGKQGETMVSEVALELEKQHGWLSQPWTSVKNAEVIAVACGLAETLNKGTGNKLRNAVQAIVRNPILRGDYGNNAPYTEIAKGFNKLMVDTGTFFKNIVAKVVYRGK